MSRPKSQSPFEILRLGADKSFVVGKSKLIGKGHFMDAAGNKLKHLEWVVQSRHSNQLCALKLLSLFYEHEERWKTKKLSRAAQDLSAVAFSLWRAAFLAEKSGRRASVFEHGKTFLERVVEDNAISYPQDKKSFEWTFNYYTRNARSSLTILHQYWPGQVPMYVGKKRNAKDRWDYCQSILEQAVCGFEKLLMDMNAEARRVKAAAEARTAKKQRRQTVRGITLAARAAKK